jgi:hypothetical protein
MARPVSGVVCFSSVLGVVSSFGVLVLVPLLLLLLLLDVFEEVFFVGGEYLSSSSSLHETMQTLDNTNIADTTYINFFISYRFYLFKDYQWHHPQGLDLPIAYASDNVTHLIEALHLFNPLQLGVQWYA